MTEPPKGLGAHGRKLWDELTIEWEFSEADHFLLKTLCELYQEFQEHRATLKKEGSCIHTGDGMIRKHPASELLKVARNQFLMTWRLLNLRDPLEAPKVGRPPGGLGR